MKTTFLQNVMRWLLGALMVLAGIGHMTVLRNEFQAQVPRWLQAGPAFMDFVVMASGIVEICLGLCMIVLSKYKMQAGIALAIFYVLIFPGNISQYTNHINAFGLDTDQKRFNRLFFQPLLILWALWSSGALKQYFKQKSKDKTLNFYDFQADLLNGKALSMKEYQGKTIIVVNTASHCGFTPQYEGLEKLYKKYSDKGLIILAFPCNQFGNQENGSAEEIDNFCQVNYGLSFPVFSKVMVNGEEAHPLFKFLKSGSGGFINNDIKWNFTKFVIDKTGRPVKRYAPTTAPEKMESFIQQIL